MDNCFTSWPDRSRQMSEKDILYIIPAGPVRRAHSPGGASYFRDVIAFFFVSSLSKTPTKLIAGLVGWALPVNWIGY